MIFVNFDMFTKYYLYFKKLLWKHEIYLQVV